MKLELSYTCEAQEEQNEDLIMTKKDHIAVKSEHLASFYYDPYTKQLHFEFESGKMLYIGIQYIDNLRIEK